MSLGGVSQGKGERPRPAARTIAWSGLKRVSISGTCGPNAMRKRRRQVNCAL